MTDNNENIRQTRQIGSLQPSVERSPTCKSSIFNNHKSRSPSRVSPSIKTPPSRIQWWTSRRTKIKIKSPQPQEAVRLYCFGASYVLVFGRCSLPVCLSRVFILKFSQLQRCGTCGVHTETYVKLCLVRERIVIIVSFLVSTVRNAHRPFVVVKQHCLFPLHSPPTNVCKM